MEEFFYLLDNIEERLPARHTELYSSCAISEQKLREIIRYDSLLCSRSLLFIAV